MSHRDGSTFERELQAGHTEVFRRAYIKRRLSTTGLFESDWVEITNDVKKWGSIRISTDDKKIGRFKFSGMSLVVANHDGKYNRNTENDSLWFGYLNIQRTMVKIEAGFRRRFRNADGTRRVVEYPLGQTLWDQGLYDNGLWDGAGEDQIVFTGFISGDVIQNDKQTVRLPIKPLTELFRTYSAKRLTGFSAGGESASEFMQLVRDATDGANNFVFRPFFNDTTANWDISTTSITYSFLNTNTAQDVRDRTVWNVMERLAEAENKVLYVTRAGVFKFNSRDAAGATPTFHFAGVGFDDTTYGTTIKNIPSFGEKFTKYYSRILIKHVDSDTSTSFEQVEASLAVSANSVPWELGDRTLRLDNFWIPNSSAAQSLATDLFNEFNAIKNEINFSTTFVPGLDLTELVEISYDANPVDPNSLWDQNNWGDNDDVASAGAMYWDPNKGDSIRLEKAEYRLLSVTDNLDTLESRFVARET
jgi:hypothetical protein